MAPVNRTLYSVVLSPPAIQVFLFSVGMAPV
jgi:hypothetical protein